LLKFDHISKKERERKKGLNVGLRLLVRPSLRLSRARHVPSKHGNSRDAQFTNISLRFRSAILLQRMAANHARPHVLTITAVI